VARTICRRAERRVCELQEKGENPESRHPGLLESIIGRALVAGQVVGARLDAGHFLAAFVYRHMLCAKRIIQLNHVLTRCNILDQGR